MLEGANILSLTGQLYNAHMYEDITQCHLNIYIFVC